MNNYSRRNQLRTIILVNKRKSQGGFEPRTSTNACGHVCRYVDQKGSAAMLTSIQSAGVTPEVNLRITQVRKHAEGIHPGFETEGRCHQKSKNMGISGPIKRTHVLQNFKIKKDAKSGVAMVISQIRVPFRKDILLLNKKITVVFMTMKRNVFLLGSNLKLPGMLLSFENWWPIWASDWQI